MKRFEIVDQSLNVDRYKSLVIHPRAGAVIVFTGHVREWTKGIQTKYLIYEAYIPMAEKMLAKIGEEVKQRWPHTNISMAHRVGKVSICEIAVIIAVSSPHRKQAFKASEYAIRRVKEVVPIWKKDVRNDGKVWVHLADSREGL